MPYKRRYKRRNYAPKYSGSKIDRALNVGMKALVLAKGVKSIVNAEKKSYDSPFSGTAVSSTASVQRLTDIAQGDDYNGREGRSILLKSIEANLVCQIHGSATNTSMRLVIFKDKHNQGTAPTAADIGITTFYGLRDSNPTAQKRFTVLKDQQIRLQQGQVDRFPFQYFRKLNHHVIFDGTASTDDTQGSLWLLLVSNEPTNTPNISGDVRVRYYDN